VTEGVKTLKFFPPNAAADPVCAPIGSIQDAANCAIELSQRSLEFVKIM
jgi:hypothetical protein